MPTPTVERSRSPAPAPARILPPPAADQSLLTSVTSPSSTPMLPITVPHPDVLPSVDFADTAPKHPLQHELFAPAADDSDPSSCGSRLGPSSSHDGIDIPRLSSTASGSESRITASASDSPQADGLLGTTPPRTPVSPGWRRIESTAQHGVDGADGDSNHGNGDGVAARASRDSTPASIAPRTFDLPSTRIRPTLTSSFLRPYRRFSGTQKSDKMTYKVEVELKYVDMARSTMSGFLSIEGLTESLPSITTYFEAELIGTRYTFQTRHPSWGADKKTDMKHWERFPQYKAAMASSNTSNSTTSTSAASSTTTTTNSTNPNTIASGSLRHLPDANWAQRDHIFMRWKEQFLVPDHRRTDLPGASFEGFYYIVFNQLRGSITGIYYHSKSERYQQLELLPVRGPMCAAPALEFR